MKYFQLGGAPVGLFPAWTNYGWFYGTHAHMSELLGYLLAAGGTHYTFAAADTQGVPVAPMYPQGQSPTFPNIPGLSVPGYGTLQKHRVN